MVKSLVISVLVLAFAAAAAPGQLIDPTQGPGGPILVVTSPANPFSVYYAEILRAEGLSAFTVASVDDLDATLLAAHDVVLLGQMALVATQVDLLTDWVTTGGTLIVMRPDRDRPDLLSLLGLADAGGTLAWPGRRYLRIDPAAGLATQTLQYHGGADLYDLAGATALATLYSDAATPTTHPAVTVRAVGTAGGRAIAFTYDLARSVVLTRQGNPAWSGQDRDGDGRVRSNDAFIGDTPGVDDWIDLERVAIPQADEQQRLLANLIVGGRDPLPRFWYFPNGLKAVLVMTMDSHGGLGYTLTRMDEHVAQSPAGCSVDDWECVRATNYLYASDGITDAQAVAYDALGFEFALHVDTGCDSPWPDTDALRAIYGAQHPAFAAAYPNLPLSVSERGHCVTWADWDSKPLVQSEWGVRIDCTYYYEGVGPWQINSHPGMYTGSGLPMRFARLDGSLIDVFQITTQMTDESGQSYPSTAIALLDKAVGPEGYYGAFCANMHSDNGPPWNGSIAAPQIVAEAQARGVPVVSARQLLAWLDARDEASFQDLTVDPVAHTVAFAVEEAVGTLTLESMIPAVSGLGVITSVTRDGSAATFRRETIKGVDYAVFAADAGDYLVTYEPDETPPVISDLVCTVSQGGVANFTWTTDEPATSWVEFGTDPGDLDQHVSSAALVTMHALALTNLPDDTDHYYRVRSTDFWGNATVAPPSGLLTFTTPPPVCLEDDTAADFAAGTLDDGIAIAEAAGGELTLAPAVAAEFVGDALPAGWTSVAADPGGTAVVGGGTLVLDGMRAHPQDVFAQPAGAEVRRLEFTATFSAAIHQHGGLGLTLQEFPYAVFSTSADGTALWVHTRRDGAMGILEQLGAGLLGGEHRFRIEWRADEVEYFIDDALVAHHAIALGTDLRPIFFDRFTGGGTLVVDRVRMSPYAATGEYLSRVHGTGGPADWGLITWAAEAPAATSLAVSVRTGDTPLPDGTWSSFASVSSGDVLGVTSQFLQYRIALATQDDAVTPQLASLAIACTAGDDVTPPFIIDLAVVPHADGTGATITWDTSEPATSRVDYGLGPDSLPQSLAFTDLVIHHEVVLTGLAAAVTYYYQVTSADAAANAATAPTPPGSFTTLAPVCAADDTVDHFLAGTAASTYVADEAGGEVILAPVDGAEFFGDTLPAGWEWALRPGSAGGAVVADGVVTIQGAWAGSVARRPADRAVEFVATFGAAIQHAGFGELLGGPDFAIFTCDGANVRARTYWGGGAGNTIADLGTGLVGIPHRYRIVWNAGTVAYYIDGNLRATHAHAMTNPLRFIAMDSSDGGPVLVVDWARVGPQASAGSFDSRIFDAGESATWFSASWNAVVPPGTSLGVSVRSGDTPTPDGTWTSYTPVAGSGGAIGQSGRFAQYRLDLATTDAETTPVLAGLGLTCGLCGEPPAAVADLAAQRVLTGDTPGQTLAVAVNWSAPPPSTTVLLYRKGFGNYPEYDDAPDPGSVPTIPTDPAAAVAAGWVLVTESADITHVDHTSTRDCWYYVAFARNDCGLVSTASSLAGGTLNYLLGDVAGGFAPGDGDNRVDVLDVSALGDGYGVASGHAAYRNWLDVGPTHDASVTGRPLTDNVIEFEDLIIVAIGWDTVGKLVPPPAPADANRLLVEVPELPAVGEEFVVSLRLAGDGRIQGLSVPVTWDDGVVAWLGCEAGDLLARHGGLSVLLSPSPGVLDAALIGRRERGLSGEGELACIRLRVLAPGDPNLTVGDVTARSATNEDVDLTGPAAAAVPRTTTLHASAPNPFNPATTVAFDLAQAGHVRLRIFAVDGRVVRTLIDAERVVGRHTMVWNGADDAGRRMSTGAYLVRLEAPGVVQTRKVMLIK